MPIAKDLEALAVPVESLHLLPGNPRKGDVAAVARSLERFGQRKPIVVQREGAIVVAGNHTLQAARDLGWTEIAAVWTDDDGPTAKAFALADNRTAELGTYDDDLLADLIRDVGDEDPDLLSDAGWDGDAVAELLASLESDPDLGGDGDDVPDDAPSITVAGDVWLLGAHRVMCGDATSPTDVEKLMDGNLADMVWTDPPYGVSYVGKTEDALTIQNDGLEFESILNGALDSILVATKPGAAVYVAAPAGPAGIPFAVGLEQRKLFRQRLVWVKDALVLGHSDYHYKHEDIYLGYVPEGVGRRGRGGTGWYGDNSQTSVLEFPRPKASREHPTMKPVALIAYCLQNSSAPGQVVLDLFGGSGSTLMAAEAVSRIAMLMELDPHYVDVICRRYQELTGDKPVSCSTGQMHDFTVDV